MLYIKNKIIQYLQQNEIDLLELGDKFLKISLIPEYAPKWGYLVEKLNTHRAMVTYSYSNNIFTITFNSSEPETLKRDLYVFYETLRKKYYLVRPKVKKTSVLIKPTHRCNLDCKYCYDKPYRDKIKSDMSMAVLEEFIKKAAQHTECLQIIWHGGEPTMVGTSWYEKAYNEVLSKYPMLSIESSIMSNGINYNKDWFKLFKKYKISPGMSYNAMYQNELRCYGGKSRDNYSKDEQWEFKQDKRLSSKVDLENTLVTFKEHGLSIGTIDVIAKQNYAKQIEIYEYYKSIGCKTCMNHFFYTSGVEENSLAISPEEYTEEFLKYFKHWLYDKNGIYERSAAEALGFVIGFTNSCCENQDCRKAWLGLNPEGDLYPCDRYFPEKYKIGNIKDFDSIDEIFDSRVYTMYSSEVQKRFDKCSKCGCFSACKGGCSASAVETTGSAEGVDEFSCQLFKLKFHGIYGILRNVDVLQDTLNPYAKRILITNSFYSIKDINGYIKETGKPIELEYDSENLFECSEYKVFRGINFVKNGKCEVPIHSDFVNSNNTEVVAVNEQKRKEDFFNYLRAYVESYMGNSSPNPFSLSKEKGS